MIAAPSRKLERRPQMSVNRPAMSGMIARQIIEIAWSDPIACPTRSRGAVCAASAWTST
jgi:hypothetical protein